MLVFSVGHLHIYREGRGLRITIPIAHSSTVLTQDEAKEMTKALANLFKKKETAK